MEQYHQMNFPVISDENKLIGIVDFDDAKKFILENKLNETAGTVMRKEFIFVTSTDPLRLGITDNPVSQVAIFDTTTFDSSSLGYHSVCNSGTL